MRIDWCLDDAIPSFLDAFHLRAVGTPPPPSAPCPLSAVKRNKNGVSRCSGWRFDDMRRKEGKARGKLSGPHRTVLEKPKYVSEAVPWDGICILLSLFRAVFLDW